MKASRTTSSTASPPVEPARRKLAWAENVGATSTRVGRPPRSRTRQPRVAGAALAALAFVSVLAPAPEAAWASGKAPAAVTERFLPVAPRDAAPPPLALSDLQGRKHDLTEYRGRVVVLNFWATWCAPCLAEIPTLELLQARFAQEPVTVLTVNHGESVERVEGFVDKMAIDLPVLLDAFHRVRYDWKVRALPLTYLLDRNGRLRYTVRGEIDWTSDEAIARVRALVDEK